MTDSDPRNPPVVDLLDDYRRRREALQTEARELAKLQADVLSAAERDGAAIVASARTRIAQILSESRRDLQHLARRIEGVARLEREEPSAVLPIKDPGAAHESVLRARRDIAQVFANAKPELERLYQAAKKDAGVEPAPLRQPFRPMPPDVPFAPPEPAPASVQAPAFPVAARRRWPAVPIVVLAIAAVVVILAAMWWLRQPARRVDGLAVPPAEPPVRPPAASTAVAQPSKAAPPRQLSLIVEARRPVWIRVTKDGRSDSALFSAGQRTPISANREISIRAGDAGAVSVSVNGAAAQALGRDGEVLTRRYTADGQPPPAEPAPAPPRNPAASPPPATSPPSGEADRSGRSASPAAAAAPANAAAAPAMELTTTAQRWLDAYYRQDLPTMRSVAAPDMKRSDQRSVDERLPPSADNVRRTLENVSFQFVGETAILTGRMLEQGTVGGQSTQRISWVSLMWIREGGRWLLADVQILSDAKLRSR